MTNTSKFWLSALILGAVVGGAVVANRNRVEVTPAVPVATEASAPAVEKAPLPMPKVNRVAVSPLVLNDTLAADAKPLLQRGTDITMAVDGFTSRESFLATAHAAKNLGIPFVVLKDRVVAQKKTLTAAIREIKPEVNAKAEADRATAEARSTGAQSN